MQEFNLIGSMLTGKKSTEQNGFAWYQAAISQIVKVAAPEEFYNNVVVCDQSGNPAQGVTIPDNQPFMLYIMADYVQKETNPNDGTSSPKEEINRVNIAHYYTATLNDPGSGTMNGSQFVPNLKEFGPVTVTFVVKPDAPETIKSQHPQHQVTFNIQPVGTDNNAIRMKKIKEPLRKPVQEIEKGYQELNKWYAQYQIATQEPWTEGTYYQGIATIVQRVMGQMKTLIESLRSIERTKLASIEDAITAEGQSFNTVKNLFTQPVQTIKDTFRDLGRGGDVISVARKYLKDNNQNITKHITGLHKQVDQARKIWESKLRGVMWDIKEQSGLVAQIDDAFTKMNEAFSGTPSSTPAPAAPNAGAGASGGRGGAPAGGGGGIRLSPNQVVTTPSGPAVTVNTLNSMGIPVSVGSGKKQVTKTSKNNSLAPKEWDLSFLKFE